MKTPALFYTALLCCLAGRVYPQAITASPQLNFGTAFENAPDSVQLAISNTLNRTVNVNGIKFYDTYGVPAFSATEQNFSIAPSSSYSIWIKFSPRHNIFHNSEMVIVNDGLLGYLNVDLIGQGKYSKAYYDSSENYSEEALKTALHNLTGTGYVALGYNIGRDSMFMWLDNKRTNGQGAAQNTIECIYTGREAVGYTDRSDCQTNFSFNTEHTFPQSFFNSLEPMKSDLHHIFPTDDVANNYRGDNPFGIVSGATLWAAGGSKATSSLFEPRDAQKGVAARALMYFVLRYQNYSNFLNSQESILRTWHHDFPATQIEEDRNDDIDLIQHNRNPFVDYPQFIERITSLSTTSVAPVVKSIDLAEDTIIYGFVPQGVPVVFHYVIVNQGNSPVQFSNFSLSQPGLTFQSGGSNTSLAAGEALPLDIKLIASNTDSIHAFLNFNTDDSAHLSVSVPIFANDSVLNAIQEEEKEEVNVFPNPAGNALWIMNGKNNMNAVRVYDSMGRNVLEYQRKDRLEEMVLDISSLQKGIYFIAFSEGEKIFFRKLVKGY